MGKKFQNTLPYVISRLYLKNCFSCVLDKVANNLLKGLSLALNISDPPRRSARKEKPDWWDENIEELGNC